MGGNVFKNSRRAKFFDKNFFGNILNDLGLREYHDYKFLGSSHFDSNDGYGDIDIAIDSYYEVHVVQYLQDRFETTKNGKTFHVNYDGAQIDINFVKRPALHSWLPHSTITTFDDPYKSLFRNELLFVITKYRYGIVVNEFDGKNIITFSRFRFDIHNGIVFAQYSYRSKSGNILKTPRKVRDNITVITDWNVFVKDLSPDFFFTSFEETLEAIRSEFQSSESYIPFIEEVKRNLIRKGHEVPKELLNA